MISLWRHDPEMPRAPLAGRLLGFGLALAALAIAVRLAADTIVVLLPVLLPLAVLIGIYRLLLGCLRSRK